MAHQALYRAYRPKNFGEVLGQDHIVSVLERAIEGKKLSHAYLFFGSRGTGKTSVARIIAKELGVSEADIYEIDAASNRGIDDIRELREAVKTFPFDSKYKVYIIDEVHMLTKEAFNALLKTLEEPPKHVIFILATTELHKVPDTIISRCQTFTFKKPSEAVLRELVTVVAKKEGIKIDKAGIELVTILGDGSFRDTYGILEKVLVYSKDKTVTREEIEAITGAPNGRVVREILEAISEADISKALMAVGKAKEQNSDMRTLAKLLLTELRAVFLLRIAPDSKKKLIETFGEDDVAFLEKIAKNAKSGISSKTLVSLIDAYHLIDSASFVPELPLELALTEIISGK